jgi:hypothetical protein
MEALMRHLGSIVLSLLLGPIIYVLTGIGLVRLAGAPRDWYTADPTPVALGLAALVGAGILYAILLLVRLSPIGPVLVGLGYLGLTVWGLLRTESLTDLIPERYVGSAHVTGGPTFGVSLLLAIPLLATIGSPRRWRRRPDGVTETAEDAAYPTSPAPAYTGYPGAPIYTPPATTPVPPTRSVPADPEPGEQTTALPVPNAPTPVAQRPVAPQPAAPTPVAPTLTAPTPPAAPPAAPQPKPVSPAAQGTTKTAQAGSTAASQTWPVSPGPTDSDATRRLPSDDEPDQK